MAFTRNISLSDKIQVVAGLNNATVNNGTTAYATTTINTAGYQSCCLVLTQAAQANSANTCVLSCGYGVNTGTNTAIANSSVTVGANTTTQILEIARPSKQYLTPIVTGPTGGLNATVTVIAILAGREPPVATVVNASQTFNTTTALFTGTQNVSSSTNSPTSILLVPNP